MAASSREIVASIGDVVEVETKSEKKKKHKSKAKKEPGTIVDINTIEDVSIVVARFDDIFKFVTDLNESFGTGRKPLKLYHALLSKIKPIHTQSMKTHIDLFYKYCVTHADKIIAKDSDGLKKILYRVDIHVDVPSILNDEKTEKTEKSAIWNHLLVILYKANPSKKVKSVFEGLSSKETKFFEDMNDKIMNAGLSDKDMSDPASAMMSLMSSGALADMMSGMKNGDFDLKRLLNTAKVIINKIEIEEDETPSVPSKKTGSTKEEPSDEGVSFDDGKKAEREIERDIKTARESIAEKKK